MIKITEKDKANFVNLVIEVIKEGQGRVGVLGRVISKLGLVPFVLVDLDDEGGSYPTWVGGKLRKGKDICMERFDKPLPEETGYVVINYGDPCYAYCGRFRKAGIEEFPLAEIEEFLRGIIPQEIASFEAKEVLARKSWGQKMNEKLREQGLSEQEVHAWWSLGWKREVSPEEWARLLREISENSIQRGLNAHAGWVLKQLGLDFGKSFHRTMAIVRGLAKAKGLEAAPPEKFQKNSEPAPVDPDGVWGVLKQITF